MSTPGPHVPDRVLVALTVFLLVALVATVVVSLLVWHTPALNPLPLPSASHA